MPYFLSLKRERGNALLPLPGTERGDVLLGLSDLHPLPSIGRGTG
jgi:hypothetical protein